MLKALAAAWLLAPPAGASAVDLHVHLLMDASLPGLFRGHPTREPSGVTDRAARFANQVSLKDLEAADVRLIAAALYTPLGGTRALLKQLSAVETWAARHGAVIVRTPDEAQAVLESKDWRLGVILAAEGGHGVDTPERLERLWERGLRMVTLTHFRDNAWGGAAAARYWPRSSCVPGGADDGRRNPKGLSKEGEALVDLAVEKGLLLDLTHASDRTALDVARRHPRLPLLFSHQAARELTPCERTLPPELLREVKRSGGMVGVTFAAGYVGERLEDLLAHARALAREAGPEALALGSDYNGFIRRIEGAAGSEGYARVLEALAAERIPARRSAEAFVELWRRTNAARSRSPRPERRRG